MKLCSIILFSLLLLSGCVKNTISIYLNPNGEFDMLIQAQGDEADILDNDFPITNILKDSSWKISSTLDSNDVDTHNLIVSKKFKANSIIPQNFNIDGNKKSLFLKRISIF